MKNNSKKIFVENLECIYKKKQCTSLKEMAELLNVSVGTLKCWKTGNRMPRLTNLDAIANELGCYTYQLLAPCGDFNNIGIYHNDIHKVFSTNLKIIFIERQAVSNAHKWAALNQIVSFDTVVSYLRPENYRLPSLNTLDKIADQFDMKTFELIKEDLHNEKKTESEE